MHSDDVQLLRDPAIDYESFGQLYCVYDGVVEKLVETDSRMRVQGCDMI